MRYAYNHQLFYIYIRKINRDYQDYFYLSVAVWTVIYSKSVSLDKMQNC